MTVVDMKNHPLYAEVERQDAIALEKVLRVVPQWSGLTRVRDVLGDERRILLHAGPPFNSIDTIPRPVMNSLCVGCVYEGWAKDFLEALELICTGKIDIRAAQDHDIVVPLAGVVSPSMVLLVVQDAQNPDHRKYSVLNEGMTLCTRLGILHDDLPAHLTWLNTDVAGWIEKRIQGPVDMLAHMRASLTEGDDCHSRTIAGSAKLVQSLLDVRDAEEGEQEIVDFLRGSLAFSLNHWMAASALILSAAENTARSGLVTKAAGNGFEFGIQIAGVPGEWITVKAPEIVGHVEERHAGRVATGGLGDSAVVDFLGLGGQALDCGQATFAALSAKLPENALSRGETVLAGLHPALDRPVATSSLKAVQALSGPFVLLGMIDAAGTGGRIGGGFVDTPAEIFRLALGKLA